MIVEENHSLLSPTKVPINGRRGNSSMGWKSTPKCVSSEDDFLQQGGRMVEKNFMEMWQNLCLLH